MNDLPDNSCICLPFLFTFFLMIFPKEVIWSKNRHFKHLNCAEKATQDNNMVRDTINNTWWWINSDIVVLHSFWSNWLQRCKGSFLELDHVSVGCSTFYMDDGFFDKALLRKLLSLRYSGLHFSLVLRYRNAVHYLCHRSNSWDVCDACFHDKGWELKTTVEEDVLEGLMVGNCASCMSVIRFPISSKPLFVIRLWLDMWDPAYSTNGPQYNFTQKAHRNSQNPVSHRFEVGNRCVFGKFHTKT